MASTRCPELPRPHAILFPVSAQGHVNPFLALANLLASKGIAISFVSPLHRISRLRSDPNVFLHPLVRLVGLPEKIHPSELDVDEGFNSIAYEFDLIDSMKDEFEAFIRHSLAAADASRIEFGAPDYIISDPFVRWMKSVSDKLSVPMLDMFTSPVWSMTALIHVPKLSEEGLLHLPLRSTASPKLITLPGLPPLPDTTVLYNYMLDVVPHAIRRAISNCALVLSQSSRMVVNTTYEIEQKYIEELEKEDPYNAKLKILTIGPLIASSHGFPDDADDDDDQDDEEEKKEGDEDQVQLNTPAKLQDESQDPRLDCLEWLDTQPLASVVYISFGSMYIPSDNEVTEMAHGLEASGKRFLWILRPPPSQKSTLQRLRSWVSRVLPEGFQSRTKQRGFISHEWAPQQQILAKPAVGMFWTHCGWNSVIESMWNGVPMIAYPQFAEQRINCRMIVDELKVSVEVAMAEEGDGGGSFPDRNAVERVLRRVSEGEEGARIRRNVAEARKKMRKAVKVDGSSYRNVQLIIEEILGHFMTKVKK